MKKLALALAATAAFALAVPMAHAAASIETPEAQMMAQSAADEARFEVRETFGDLNLKPGQYRWADESGEGPTRIVISLGEQRVYVYRGARLVAVSTISSGKPGKDTPTGIFPILEKQPLYHSRKYDNAAMPFMQRIDDYGIALHAGVVTRQPASHGCVRLPAKFAAKLYGVTQIGSQVLIGV